MDSVARVCIPTLRSGVDRSAARALVEELRAKGFAYVAHPALVPEVLQRAKLAGRNLLTTCSLEERQRCAAPPSGFRGFYQYVGASGTGDQIQCFSMGAPVTSRKEALDLRGTYYTRVGWSEEAMDEAGLARLNECPSDFDIEHMAALTTMRKVLAEELTPALMNHVTAGIEEALGESFPELWSSEGHSAMAAAHSKRDGNFEVKLYPAVASSQRPTDTPAVVSRKVLRGGGMNSAVSKPAPAATKTTAERLSTHQDLSSITVLAQDSMGGLEVLDTETGAFCAVPVLEDAVLINAGVFMERWTDGRIAATPHRVRNTTSDASSRDRCSLVYFAFPDFDASVAPLLFEDREGPVESYPLAGDLHPLS